MLDFNSLLIEYMTERNTSFLHIHENDNVLVALTDLLVGNKIDFQSRVLDLKYPIPTKHKVFINDMKEGDEVYMYGVVVGKLTEPVQSGMLMTTTNTVHTAEPYAYRVSNYSWKAPDVSAFYDKTFMGYHRSNGKVGTANYWLFIPTVFCENRNLDVIKEALHHSLGYAVTGKYLQFAKLLAQSIEKKEDIHNIDFQTSDPIAKRVLPNIDGIKFLNHQGGCGGTRQDSDSLSKLLAAYADHPNVAGDYLIEFGLSAFTISPIAKRYST